MGSTRVSLFYMKSIQLKLPGNSFFAMSQVCIDYDLSFFSCNIDPEFRGEDQPIKELLRRVANFNCMKRTFVSECWGAIEKKRGKEKDE